MLLMPGKSFNELNFQFILIIHLRVNMATFTLIME